MAILTLDPGTTALALIDLQRGIVVGDTATHFFPTIGRVRATRDVITALR